MWLQDNVARHFKRATMTGFTLSFANTAGVAVGQIFTAQTAPRYIKGLFISLGLTVLALIMVFVLVIGMTVVNKKRDRKVKAAIEAGEPLLSNPDDGDYDVHFRYSI